MPEEMKEDLIFHMIKNLLFSSKNSMIEYVRKHFGRQNSYRNLYTRLTNYYIDTYGTNMF